MKIKIDDNKIVHFVTLILQVKNGIEVENSLLNVNQKREVYQTICKNSKDELDAYNEAMLKAQQKFHIIQVEAKTISLLTPKIFASTTGDEKK